MLILAERNLKNIKHIPFHNYDILLKKKKKITNEILTHWCNLVNGL